MKQVIVWVIAITISAGAWAAVKPNGLVILTTDYGADSIYVGEIKGAIYNKFPQARVDSITNSIPPYDIVTGAYILLESTSLYPSGTTFVCIVDPGVGTPRKPIVLETKDGQRYVGPDNGILSLVADKYGVAEIRECANAELWRAGDVSHTFHGRDIFGPVAAALASGAPLDKVGPKLEKLTKLDTIPSSVEGETINGSVMRVDDYGNIVTNIPAANLEKAKIKKGDALEVTIGKTTFTAPLVGTYGDVPKGQRLVDIQSAGYVEFAVNMGDLVKETGEGVKAKVTIRKK